MPDRYPNAVWNPGVNAGYRAGRNTMRTAVCHYTVGRNSTPIGLRGYFQFLIARDGTVQQFAEADAVCWHAGDPWNSRGPGIEVEYYDEAEVFTDAQRAACAELVKWLGIPLDLYDGPRVADHHGFITHRSLLQSGDAHSDYWPQEDWDAMTGPAQEEAEMALPLLVHKPGENTTYVLHAGYKVKTASQEVGDTLQYLGLVQPGWHEIGASFLDAVPEFKATPAATGGTSVTVPAGPLKVTLTGSATPV